MNIARHILLGRYTDKDTPLHRQDARVKFFFLFSVSLALFLSSGFRGYLLPSALLIAAVPLSGIGFTRLLRGILPVLWLILFTFILNYFATSARRAVFFSLRLLLLFAWASVLTATTPTDEAGRAVAWFLSPLKVFGVSPSGIAFAFALALRFFPIVLEEAEGVIKAQKLKKEKRGPLKFLVSFTSVFLIRVMRRADAIEAAVENRGLPRDNPPYALKANPAPGGYSAVILAASLSCVIFAL